MFTVLKKDGKARRGTFETVHGTFQTPCFMNVGTAAAIKGGISSVDLKGLKTQVELCNTYHLHLRPGDRIIRQMGGLHKFMNWDKPILTDSGGFQVFSLAKLRKIKEEGVYFASHIDGRRIFMGPEESMQIQSNLASTIAMAFDECIENPSPYKYVAASIERTTRWLHRCKEEMARLNSLPDTINKHQMLFGINQGSTFDDLRIKHMEDIAKLDLDGYAIGGLAVGESTEEMYRIIDVVEPYMPSDKPRYLMGVGTPSNIIESVARGVDMFDCVMPSRNARHATVFTWSGIMHLANKCYETDRDRLTSSVTARPAAISRALTCATFSRPTSSLQADLQSSTTFTSIIRLLKRYARLLTRIALSSSAANIPSFSLQNITEATNDNSSFRP